MSVGVKLEHLTVRFGSLLLFEDLSIEFPAGSWTCLLGRSGVGKSTLSRVVTGLDAGVPISGELCDADGGSLAGRVAWMAQQDLLLPWLNVLDNVTLGPRLRREAPDLERARSLLKRTGLAGTEAQLPATLSGGMRQRVALVRTLMEDRPVIVLDEPFAAVDALTRMELQSLAFELLAGRTVILITHDPQEALRLGHRVLVLRGAPAKPYALEGLETAPPRALRDSTLIARQIELLEMLA